MAVVSYLVHYDTLLQNMTAILLLNATKVYYKMRQFYYYLRQLLQNAPILLQNATVITNFDVYYKCVGTIALQITGANRLHKQASGIVYYDFKPTFKDESFSIHDQNIERILIEMAIWKSRHRHLGISIGIDVGIGIGFTKILFCLAKSLFLPFEVLYEEKIHGEVLFKYTC